MKLKGSIVSVLVVLTSGSCQATPICLNRLRVAVIDTGLNLSDPRFKNHLCSSGHNNFTNESMDDNNGHGSHVAGLIQLFAKQSNYCLLIYKYYSNSASEQTNMYNEVRAMSEAVDNGAQIVNFSGGGPGFNEQEYFLIKSNPNVTFVVAAGNEGHDLDTPTNKYYPASYGLPNEKIIAAVNSSGSRAYFSNFGSKVTSYELGENVLSYLPNGKTGRMSGSSQATAIFSGKLVDKLSKTCNY